LCAINFPEERMRRGKRIRTREEQGGLSN
jgi:hypothetical protein